MSIDKMIAQLLNGASPRDVVEAIDSPATHYAALMMLHGVPEAEAAKRAVKMIGHEPDDEILHMAAKNTTQYKNPNMERHWIKQGHYNPERTPKYLDAAGNSIDD